MGASWRIRPAFERRCSALDDPDIRLRNNNEGGCQWPWWYCVLSPSVLRRRMAAGSLRRLIGADCALQQHGQSGAWDGLQNNLPLLLAPDLGRPSMVEDLTRSTPSRDVLAITWDVSSPRADITTICQCRAVFDAALTPRRHLAPSLTAPSTVSWDEARELARAEGAMAAVCFSDGRRVPAEHRCKLLHGCCTRIGHWAEECATCSSDEWLLCAEGPLLGFRVRLVKSEAELLE